MLLIALEFVQLLSGVDGQWLIGFDKCFCELIEDSVYFVSYPAAFWYC